MEVTCFLCGNLVNGNENTLSQHFRDRHCVTISRGIHGTNFICGQNGCRQDYRYFRNLMKHIKNIHLNDRNRIPAANHLEINNPPENRIHNCNDAGNNHQHLNDDDIENEVDRENIIAEDEFNPRMFAIRMISRLQSHGSMTSKMMTSIMDECGEFLSNVQRSLQAKVIAGLAPGHIIDHNVIEHVNKVFEDENLFEGLKTYEQQINALKENCSFVDPIEIPLGRRMDVKLDKNSCTYIQGQIMETYQYVPIIDVLKMILSNGEVREAIHQEQQSPNGILGSFIDGQHFKNHPFFQQYKNALRIRLYYDELEIVNPLGSKTNAHKLGVFYYQIANLPPHMNSQLDSIHVLLLCCHGDIVKYGFKNLLRPFLEDLARLSSDEGVQVNFDDELYLLRANLESFCGDGLAVHEVFNLLGPACNQFCRLCMYSRHDLHARSLENGITRTEDVLNEQLNHLRRLGFSDRAKTETGVKGECCLNDCRDFHIAGNKVFDIMHDFLCGICPMVVKLVLHEYVVVQKRFNIKYLNEVISTFNFGYLQQKNKPSANFTEGMLSKRDHTLSQKAAQTWCLIRAFPFLLAEKIPDGDEHAEVVLSLLRVMEIAFAPIISETLLPYFHELILDFLTIFSTVFPDVHWINKFHHIMHYPECILWSGPLTQFSCMRFEGKHNELKLRAQNVHNFKNPPKTLIKVSQCVQSSKWGAEDATVNRLRLISSKVHQVNTTLSKQYLLDHGYTNHQQILISNSVVRNGIEFRKSLFVILEKSSSTTDNLTLFGRIEEIIVFPNNNVFLLTSTCRTQFFDNSVNAYCIEFGLSEKSLRFTDISDLPVQKTFCYWNKVNSTDVYISLPYIII